MTHLRAAAPMLVVTAALMVVMLSGCGSSAPSDKDQIAAIVKQEGTDPATVCNHLVDALLSRLGGKRGCVRQANSATRDPSTHATSVRVLGLTATAVVADRAGRRTVTLVKQRGVWKVSGVQ